MVDFLEDFSEITLNLNLNVRRIALSFDNHVPQDQRPLLKLHLSYNVCRLKTIFVELSLIFGKKHRRIRFCSSISEVSFYFNELRQWIPISLK